MLWKLVDGPRLRTTEENSIFSAHRVALLAPPLPVVQPESEKNKDTNSCPYLRQISADFFPAILVYSAESCLHRGSRQRSHRTATVSLHYRVKFSCQNCTRSNHCKEDSSVPIGWSLRFSRSLRSLRSLRWLETRLIWRQAALKSGSDRRSYSRTFHVRHMYHYIGYSLAYFVYEKFFC